MGIVGGLSAQEKNSPNLDKTRLCLPPVFYGVPGFTTEIHFVNAVYALPGAPFPVVKVNSPVGEVTRRAWTFTPGQSQSGDHSLSFSIVLSQGESSKKSVVETALIRVVPRNAGEGDNISILIIGDSLTHASGYPNELGRLLSLPGNPRWTMIGSHRPPGAKEKICHEGYGGWTWARFATKFEDGNSQTGNRRNSPFLFPGEGGKPALNFARYLEIVAGGRRPDFVIIMLGINDCFHPDPNDPEAVTARIDQMMKHAEVLLAAIRKDSPGSEIGICLTTPGNSRQEAFFANYKNRYSRDGWKKIQFHLLERQLRGFGNRQAENLFLVPTAWHIDPVQGFPDKNAVHPNDYGYRQIASDIYAWIKWRLHVREAANAAKRRDLPARFRLNSRFLASRTNHNLADADSLRSLTCIQNRVGDIFRLERSSD